MTADYLTLDFGLWTIQNQEQIRYANNSTNRP
jgi:hypothetical protein